VAAITVGVVGVAEAVGVAVAVGVAGEVVEAAGDWVHSHVPAVLLTSEIRSVEAEESCSAGAFRMPTGVFHSPI
jgi:hypothetical protein